MCFSTTKTTLFFYCLLALSILALAPAIIAQDRCFGFGLSTDLPVAGDWNGDGRDEVAIFRNGHWSLDFNGNGLWDGVGVGNDKTFNGYGQAGDLPVAGDWNGDGVDEIGLFRNGSWFLDFNGNGILDSCAVDRCAGFGLAGDLPAVGDWNNDNKDEVAVFRNGVWSIDLNGNRAWDGTSVDLTFSFGLPGDQVAVGDWNGDGRDEAGVFRAGGWSLDANGNHQWNGPAGGDLGYLFGIGSHSPVPGNWNGSLADEIGIFLGASWRLDQDANGSVDSCTNNLPPTAEADSALLYRGRSVRVAVLNNDMDPEGSSLSVAGIARQGAHGSATPLSAGCCVAYSGTPTSTTEICPTRLRYRGCAIRVSTPCTFTPRRGDAATKPVTSWTRS